MGRNAQALSGQIQKGAQPFKKGGAVKITTFEKSGKDVEVKGVGKEGSRKEERFDKTQFKKSGKC